MLCPTSGGDNWSKHNYSSTHCGRLTPKENTYVVYVLYMCAHVRVCMYVCMYIYIYIYIFIGVYTHVHTYIHTPTYTLP